MSRLIIRRSRFIASRKKKIHSRATDGKAAAKSKNTIPACLTSSDRVYDKAAHYICRTFSVIERPGRKPVCDWCTVALAIIHNPTSKKESMSFPSVFDKHSGRTSPGRTICPGLTSPFGIKKQESLFHIGGQVVTRNRFAIALNKNISRKINRCKKNCISHAVRAGSRVVRRKDDCTHFLSADCMNGPNRQLDSMQAGLRAKAGFQKAQRFGRHQERLKHHRRTLSTRMRLRIGRHRCRIDCLYDRF